MLHRTPPQANVWSFCPRNKGGRHSNLYYKASAGQLTIGAFIENDIKAIKQVSLTWSKRHFGGQQPYFLCPACGQRVAILYLTNKIACRTCSNLAYESQRENESSRQLRRARKLRSKIGAEPLILSPIPVKPKNMHYATYERKVKMIHILERRALKTMESHRIQQWLPRLKVLDMLCDNHPYE